MPLPKIQKNKIHRTELNLKDVLRYTEQNSIVNGMQTDLLFLKDVNDFSDKKQSKLGVLLLIDDKNYGVTTQQCQQIEQIAILHKQANTFNSTSMLFQDQIQPQDFCQCGCGRGRGEYFPLCTDQQKMTFLGPGVLLIFFFIKQIRWALLALLLTYCLFSFTSSVILSDIQSDHARCQMFDGLNYYLCMVTQISTFQDKLQNPKVTQINLWIGFLMSVIWTFAMRYIKLIGIKKDEQIDQMLDSSSDYTIQIDYLPVKSYNEKELLQYIEQLWETKQQRKPNYLSSSNEQIQTNRLKIKNIQLIYNLESFRKAIDEILNLSYQITQAFQPSLDNQKSHTKLSQTKKPTQNILNAQDKSMKINQENISQHISKNKLSIMQNIRIRKIQSKKSLSHSYSNKIKVEKVQQYIKLKQKLIQKYKQLIQFRKKFLKDQNFRKQLSTTCALVQFQSNQQQKQFLKYFSVDIHKNLIESCLCQNKKLIFKNTAIKIRRASQPSDMNWLNCQKEFSYYRYFFILAMTFIILTISYTSIHFLRTSSLFTSSSMYLTVLAIQFFNRIIWNSLQFLVGYQYNNSKTEAIISLMKKSIIAQVINIIVSPLIFNFFVNNNKIYGFKGLSGVVLIFQFLMFFTMFILNVLNPFYYLKKILLSIKRSRNVIIRNLCQVIGEIDTIQEIKPVLRQYEGPQFPIAGAYVYISTSIFHTLFYCQLQPIVILIVILNILGFLAVMKYLLFRRSKIPELTNIEIFDFGLFAVGCGAAFYGTGNLYFLIISKYYLDIDIPGRYFVPGVLSLIVWFICILNPFDITIKITNLMIKFTQTLKKTRDQKQNSQLQETSSQLKKNKEIKEAQDLISKMFASNNLQLFKAERKQSYYQYSNVKKLLNFQSELKQVVTDKFENNNITEFCQSFCKQKQKNHYCSEKSSINQLRQMKTIPIQIYQTSNKLQQKSPNKLKYKNPTYLIVNKISNEEEKEKQLNKRISIEIISLINSQNSNQISNESTLRLTKNQNYQDIVNLKQDQKE